MGISLHNPGSIYFSLEFVSDPVEKARFESAMFSVTFTEITGENNHVLLNIHNIFPKHENDLTEQVFYTNYSADHPVDEEADDSSLYSTLDTSGTPTHVKGQGVHCPTAVWSFAENQSTTPRLGLEARYELFASLPAKQEIGMSFWAKATLVKEGAKVGLGLGLGSGSKRVLLKIGSNETPYERIVRLGLS
jgi:hypothetical protein